MGAVALVAAYPATVADLREATVAGSITRARKIGEAIRTGRSREANPVETVREAVGGFLVLEGKVDDVERRTEKGFSTGQASLGGIEGYTGARLELAFQNEYLAARFDGELTVTTPDLITVLDLDTGQPITAEALRYGFRVAVIGIPCSPKLRTPAGLGLVGPRYFGYEVDYLPIEERYG